MDQLQIHYVDLGVPRITDLKSDLSIGRTEGNDLVLNHPSVSRKHAKIETREGRWWLVDLKSTNGVKVNGNLISEAAVSAGDKILVGSVQLDVKAMPSVDFSGESMFDNPSGTVIRRISDFNSEFGLDLGEIQAAAAVRLKSGVKGPSTCPCNTARSIGRWRNCCGRLPCGRATSSISKENWAEGLR